jgi:hypothetical protein
MRSRLSQLISTRLSVLPESSELEKISLNIASPKDMLPAPMKTILVVFMKDPKS